MDKDQKKPNPQKFDPKEHEARIQKALDKFHEETYDSQEEELIKLFAKKKQMSFSRQKAMQTDVGLAQVERTV